VDVVITATGLRDDLLGGRAPEARLRRGRIAYDDPEYVPVVAPAIPLIRQAGGAWTATVVDGPAAGFPGYVRLTWLAEVRYPAEPHRPAGPSTAASDVRLTADATPGPQASGWGPTSPPASTVHTPAVSRQPQAVVRWGSVNEIIVTNAPVTPPFAMAQYRVVVHRVFPPGGPQPAVALPSVPITTTTTVVRDTVVTPRPLAYAVVIVDPLNRSTSPVYAQ
jgi:hypothetical protein